MTPWASSSRQLSLFDSEKFFCIFLAFLDIFEAVKWESRPVVVSLFRADVLSCFFYAVEDAKYVACRFSLCKFFFATHGVWVVLMSLIHCKKVDRRQQLLRRDVVTVSCPLELDNGGLARCFSIGLNFNGPLPSVEPAQQKIYLINPNFRG